MSVVRSGSPQALVDWDIASGKIRLQQAFPSAYCLAELLTGEVKYPGLRYDGYGDGVGTDLRAFVSARIRADWAAHREELLAFWINGEALAEAFSEFRIDYEHIAALGGLRSRSLAGIPPALDSRTSGTRRGTPGDSPLGSAKSSRLSTQRVTSW
jgi:hypothetical protein